MEIVSDVHLIKTAEKVGGSEATLLAKLGIKPFSYGLVIQKVLPLYELAFDCRAMNISLFCSHKSVVLNELPSCTWKKSGERCPNDLLAPADMLACLAESFWSHAALSHPSPEQISQPTPLCWAFCLALAPADCSASCPQVYEGGAIYDTKVLDIQEDDLMETVQTAIARVAAASLELNYPTLASIPHSVVNGYKNVLAVSVATDYDFPLAEKVSVIYIGNLPDKIMKLVLGTCSVFLHEGWSDTASPPIVCICQHLSSLRRIPLHCRSRPSWRTPLRLWWRPPLRLPVAAAVLLRRRRRRPRLRRRRKRRMT